MRHGKPRTGEYNVWRRIHSYGIPICERWDNYALFLEDVGTRPSLSHRLHLKDPASGYAPGNAYWALPTTKWKSPLYNIWRTMVARCHYVLDPGYRLYGARGISVCERWRNDYQAFYEDMPPRPSMRHTIDRIDNDRGYEPGNVKWSTPVEQSNNRRFIHRLTIKGETMSANAWARRVGISQKVIVARLSDGWSHEDAVMKPLGRKSPRTADAGRG